LTSERQGELVWDVHVSKALLELGDRTTMGRPKAIIEVNVLRWMMDVLQTVS
jgi:hypothetical protein